MPQETTVVFFAAEFEVYKAVMSFSNGSEAVRTRLFPKILKTLSVNQTELRGSFSSWNRLLNLLNLIGEEKIHESKNWSKNYRPLKNSRRFAINCHRQHAQMHRFQMRSKQGLAEWQTFFRSFQVGCDTKRGTVIAAHSFRKLLERVDNPKRSILPKVEFSNAFISLHRETMLNNVFSYRQEL